MKTCTICGESYENAKPRQKVCADCRKEMQKAYSRNHYMKHRKAPKVLRDIPDYGATKPYVINDEGAINLVGGIFKSARQRKDVAFFHGKEAQFYYDTAGVNMAELKLENRYQLKLV